MLLRHRNSSLDVSRRKFQAAKTYPKLRFPTTSLSFEFGLHFVAAPEFNFNFLFNRLTPNLISSELGIFLVSAAVQVN